MADLKTDYKDDVLDTTQNTKRKYQMIDNGDGTVSFEDVTEYLQQGDSFGADDTNATNTKVNALESDIDEINDNLTVQDYTAISATSLTKTIDEYVAQANMSDGETRRVNIFYSTYNRVIEISRIGSNYCGICLDTADVDFRYNFIKVGGASTEISPFKTIHTDTYTYPSGSTGGTYDMGVDHKNRYVNASNVYAKGKADGKTVHSTTYTYPSGSTGATYDMGVDHKYRYVNATNVYNKGKADGKIDLSDYRLIGHMYQSASSSFTKSLKKEDVVVVCNTFGSGVPSLTNATKIFSSSDEGYDTAKALAMYEITATGTITISSPFRCIFAFLRK